MDEPNSTLTKKTTPDGLFPFRQFETPYDLKIYANTLRARKLPPSERPPEGTKPAGCMELLAINADLDVKSTRITQAISSNLKKQVADAASMDDAAVAFKNASIAINVYSRSLMEVKISLKARLNPIIILKMCFMLSAMGQHASRLARRVFYAIISMTSLMCSIIKIGFPLSTS